MTNPAGAEHQVIGVPNAQVAARLARVLGMLGSRHALVVHAHAGLDELGVSGPSTISEMLMRESAWVTTYEVTPGQYGLDTYALEEVRGGSVSDNVRITLDVLAGQPGATRAIVLLNAAAALYAADAVPTIAAGIQVAAESIDSGAARARLDDLAALTTRMTSAEKAVA
jgi:anthranilate phosphoribosyltransferase